MFRPVENILGTPIGDRNTGTWSKQPRKKKVYAPQEGSKLYSMWLRVPKHWVRVNEITWYPTDASGFAEYDSKANLLHELWLGGYVDLRHVNVGGVEYREYRRWQ